ncbi:hypothetical protein [Streptomyces aquilus]|nr:hypothetical protein [Streptomyces aquilus]
MIQTLPARRGEQQVDYQVDYHHANEVVQPRDQSQPGSGGSSHTRRPRDLGEPVRSRHECRIRQESPCLYGQGMDASGQPTLDEIEDRFVGLVTGRLPRDEADRWAARWVLEDGIVWDDLSWWALNCLYGIDLPMGESGGYLHDDVQVRAWLAELRKRRGV